MEDMTKYGRYNTIVEVNPKTTYFIVKYIDGTVKGTGLDVTGWSSLKNGIVKLSYHLSTGKIINVPRYKSYIIFIEASMSIDKNGGLNNKNYHYVYIKGMGNKTVYVHKIALRTNPVVGENIGDVKLYTESIPTEMTNDWKWAIY